MYHSDPDTVLPFFIKQFSTTKGIAPKHIKSRLDFVCLVLNNYGLNHETSVWNRTLILKFMEPYLIHTNLNVRESANNLAVIMSNLIGSAEVDQHFSHIPKKKLSKSSSRAQSPIKVQKPTGEETKHSRTSTGSQLDLLQQYLLNNFRVCIFCGKEDPKFTNESLDIHYWKECKVLTQCKHCNLVFSF
jgi:hypothetical protein